MYDQDSARRSLKRLLDHTNLAKHSQIVHPHNDVDMLAAYILSLECQLQEACNTLQDMDSCHVSEWDMPDDWECPHDGTNYTCGQCWAKYFVDKA